MSAKWDSDKAFDSLSAKPGAEIADILLDQEIFAGVGNIIKNEVLWRVRIHPETKVRDIPKADLKSACPRCGTKVKREKTGKRKRISHYCPVCQIA